MKKVDAKRKLGCKIAAECFRTGKLAKADVDKIVAGLDPKLVRDGIPYGAGLLVEVGLYEEPKMLGEMRQALFVHQPRNIAPVRYVANAPTDAGSWLASVTTAEPTQTRTVQTAGRPKNTHPAIVVGINARTTSSMTRAMQSSCFCPCERLPPSSPMTVS